MLGMNDHCICESCMLEGMSSARSNYGCDESFLTEREKVPSRFSEREVHKTIRPVRLIDFEFSTSQLCGYQILCRH